VQWKIRDRKIEFDRTWIAGILNITPDSFSDGGLCLSPEDALKRAEAMLAEGADMLDLGSESTRPGADTVNAKEELVRLLPVLKALRKRTVVPISIDTSKTEVARECINEGADIINDVSGLSVSGETMARVVADSGCGLILMHMRGTPKTMQTLTQYSNVTSDVLSELNEKVYSACAGGVDLLQIAVDPGLGFAKTAEQNIELMRHAGLFHKMGRPIMLGPSRKAFIGKVTGKEAQQRDCGTAGAAAFAVLQGIHMIRVHNVSCVRDAVKMIEAIKE